MSKFNWSRNKIKAAVNSGNQEVVFVKDGALTSSVNFKFDYTNNIQQKTGTEIVTGSFHQSGALFSVLTPISNIGQNEGSIINITGALRQTASIANVFAGGMAYSSQNISTANVTASLVTFIQLYKNTSLVPSIMLPTAARVQAGYVYKINDTASLGGHVIYPQPTSSATIDGSASLTLGAGSGALEVVSNGTNWFITNVPAG